MCIRMLETFYYSVAVYIIFCLGIIAQRSKIARKNPFFYSKTILPMEVSPVTFSPRQFAQFSVKKVP